MILDKLFLSGYLHAGLGIISGLYDKGIDTNSFIVYFLSSRELHIEGTI